MNLLFENIQDVMVGGVPCVLQRAPITPNLQARFWYTYRMLPASDRHLVSVRKEANGVWYAYRQRVKGIAVQLNGSTPCASFQVPYALKRTDKLYPYQPEIVAHLCASLLAHNAAADGSDTGIGKTYAALGVCRELNLVPAVICRLGGIAGWKRALRYMDIAPRFLVNWEMAKNGRFPFASRTKGEYSPDYTYTWHLPKGTLLIFDEAHLANHKGSQNYALYTGSTGLASLSLSATFSDRPARLRALFSVLGITTEAGFSKLLSEHGCYTNSNELDPEEGSWSDEQDMAEFSKILYPEYGYRISDSHPGVRDWFPDVIRQVEVVSLASTKRDMQNSLYRTLMDKAAQYQAMAKQADALAAITRYRQQAELLKADALVDLTTEYLYEGKSVIIFCNYRETLTYLSHQLKTTSVIHGQQNNREEVIDAFQRNETRLLLAMSDAGGSSIDMHDTHGGHPRVSLVCPTYHPITLKQVLGRTRRAGAKSIPIIKLVYAEGTIEEKVADRVLQKIRNINALNEGDLAEPDAFILPGR